MQTEPNSGLALDTWLDRRDDTMFRAVLSERWQGWSPNGGYLAALALRAAGTVTMHTRPVAVSCDFVNRAEMGELDLSVRSLRRSRVAELLAVEGTQGDKTIFASRAWATSNDDGLEHDNAPCPDVPPPSQVVAIGDNSGVPMGANFEVRQITWSDTWPPQVELPAVQQAWIRFVPAPTFDDPFVDGGRVLILADSTIWPAVIRAHLGNPAFTAPTLSLNVRFHRVAAGDGWLLCDSRSPTATAGVVDGEVRIWGEGGGLVASGSASMLCRPIA